MAPAVDEEPQGAPDWIVTFTDLVSLLVAFFVLLMTFSSLDNWDSFVVRGDLLGTTGIIKTMSGPTVIDPLEDDIMQSMDALRGAEHPHSRPTEKLPESIAEMGQKLTEEHHEIDLKQVKDGIVILFGPSESFGPGSSAVNAALAGSLRELGRTLENYSHMITIEGHTSSEFRATPEFDKPEALAFARAESAANVILASSNMSPKMVQLAGHGDKYPLNANETPSDRQLNRRIEIRILSLSKARTAAIEKEER